MIVNDDWRQILSEAADFSMVAEFYSPNAVPTSDGFDPATAVLRMAAVDGIEYMGTVYNQLVRNFGRISRTMTEQTNTASVEIDNLSRIVAQFEFTNGFEGMIMVIRLISRTRSTTLAKSQILFTGRCDRPTSGTKERITVVAKFILGSLNVTVPRRTYGPEDHKGRAITDPEFEGFPFTPQFGTTSYTRIEHRGGFLKLWNRKEVRATLQYSSYSDATASQPVNECFGRVQLQLVLMGAADVGTVIKVKLGACEGEIQDITNVRSLNTAMPVSGVIAVFRGLVGTLNGPDDPTWPAPGYNSRTAFVRTSIVNSAVDVTDPAPDVVAVIEGKIITIPDAAGVWNTEAWTDNGAAVVRHFLTDENYFNLDPNWIDDEFFTETFRYNAAGIFNTSLSDFTFVAPG